MTVSSDESAIQVNQLTFGWSPDQPLLQNCHLHIPQGQFWMLLGANGSGKSTLLQLLGGLIPCPNGSKLRVLPPVGYVFQNPDHQLIMPTVGADVAFGLTGEGLSFGETRLRVEYALVQVGLVEVMFRPIYTLSGGQKQRVAIAGALARQSKVLLLDEPTALLDPESQQELVKQVRQLVDRQGITALWITHRLGELPWADQAVLLSEGHIVEQGSPAQVRQTIQRESTRT